MSGRSPLRWEARLLIRARVSMASDGRTAEKWENPLSDRLARYLAHLTAMGVLNCRNPLLAAHQFMGALNGFSLWPWMIGRESLPVPVEEIVEETVRMFLPHYRRPRSKGAGDDGRSDLIRPPPAPMVVGFATEAAVGRPHGPHAAPNARGPRGSRLHQPAPANLPRLVSDVGHHSSSARFSRPSAMY